MRATAASADPSRPKRIGRQRRAIPVALAAVVCLAGACASPRGRTETFSAPTSAQSSSGAPRIVSVAAAGTATVWVQLSDGRVLFSADGGATWADRTPPGWETPSQYSNGGQRPPGLAGESVTATSAWLERGFVDAAGQSVEVAGTAGQGLSWRIEALPTTSSDAAASGMFSPTGVSFVGLDGWAATSPARLQADGLTDVFRTTNGGSTWTYETSLQHATGPIYFVTASVGFDGTTPGQFALWETRDGGHSWSQASLPPQPGFDVVSIPSDPIFTDSLHGFLYTYFQKQPAAEATYPYMYVTGGHLDAAGPPEQRQEPLRMAGMVRRRPEHLDPRGQRRGDGNERRGIDVDEGRTRHPPDPRIFRPVRLRSGRLRPDQHLQLPPLDGSGAAPLSRRQRPGQDHRRRPHVAHPDSSTLSPPLKPPGPSSPWTRRSPCTSGTAGTASDPSRAPIPCRRAPSRGCR